MTPTLLFIALWLNAAPTAGEAALADAKAARTALKADAEKKKFRHNWQNVAKKLEAAATKCGKAKCAAEATALAAQTYLELSKFSGNKEDADAAERLMKKAKESPAPAPTTAH